MTSFNLEKKISKTLRTCNPFFGTKHPAAHGVFCQIGFNEAPGSWQLGFQDPATPIMEGIIDLHHDIMFFIIVIIVFVSWLLFKLSYTYKVPYEANSLVWAGWWIPRSFKVHNTFLETVWTIIPSAILILILIPTFILFYAAGLDSEYINAQRPYIIQGSNKVKIIKFDSYTLKVSSSGVLDSWVLPYSGIKLDACPGFFKKTGIEIYSIYEQEHVGDDFIMAHRRGALSTVVKGQDFLMWIYVHNDETGSFHWRQFQEVAGTPRKFEEFRHRWEPKYKWWEPEYIWWESKYTHKSTSNLDAIEEINKAVKEPVKVRTGKPNAFIISSVISATVLVVCWIIVRL